MSIETELVRIKKAKDGMKLSIRDKGVPVGESELIDTYASKINQIESGSAEKIDLSGTGWETESVFPLSVDRIKLVSSDLDYTRQKYAEWDPATDDTSDLYYRDDKLVYAPKIDMRNVQLLYETFRGCSNLVAVPELNTSRVTYMRSCFNGCVNLERVPLLNTSRVEDISSCFMNCTRLKEVPLFDTSNVTDFEYSFCLCKSLITVPPFDMHKATTIAYMFHDCTSLKYLPLFDATNIKNAGRCLIECVNLTEFPGFHDIKVSLDLGDCPKLSLKSLKSIINELGVKDASFNPEPTLSLHTNSYKLLSADDIKIAEDKGWIVKIAPTYP